MSLRKQAIINSFGNTIYFGALWTMTVITTWKIGYTGVGMLTLAMSIGNTIVMIQMYGVRSFQSSDMSYRYSTKDYLRSRLMTILIGVSLGFLSCLFLGYADETVIVVMSYILIKSAEAFSDVLYGNEQRAGHLEYAGYSMATRGIVLVLLFWTATIIFNKLSIAMIFSAAGMIGVSLVIDVPIHNITIKDKDNVQHNGVFGILKECFPLLIMTIIPAIITSIPRIALEKYHGAIILGYYGNVTTPALLLTTVVPAILTAFLPVYGKAVQNNDVKIIRRLIKKSILLVVLVTCVFVIGIFLIGKTILAAVYTIRIIPYVKYLYFVTLALMLYAISMCNNAVFISYRNSWTMTIIAGTALIICAAMSLSAVKYYGIMGAIASLGIPYLIENFLQLIWIYIKLKQEEALI